MAKFLGLDLGTNSIGWAIRETERYEREFYDRRFSKSFADLDNEIVDYGVIIFQKGVGEGKSGEYSLAAERRKNRSKRRLYNAKRYRKWALLKLLIEHEMCPLKPEELKLWSVGQWKEINGKKKNIGRIYPLENKAFQQWLAFDPVFFSDKGVSKKGKPIRKNPYDIRCELIARQEDDETIRKIKLGRALYHLVQRRGFKSSRKSGKSTYAENVELEKLKTENPNFQIAVLAKENLDKGKRFRASGVIQRRYFEDEFFAICKKQNLDNELTEKLYKAIYFVRPLRSQKGLVGNCTLEKNKPRIPIGHPKFEEFRALQFINNIQWRETGSKKRFEAIPMQLKKRIFEELFFRRLGSGKNKGKVHSDGHFKFDDIIEKYSEKGRYEFNYKNKPNVSTCPVTASLMNVFDAEWGDKFITDENAYGINWDGLKIVYELKYGKLKKKIKEGRKIYEPKNIGEKRILDVDAIWHLLFDFIQIKDKQDELEIFCKNVLNFNEEKSKAFASIDISQGYGSLSYKAISKIIPFLQNGFIYSEAVSFANLKSVLGNQIEEKKEQAKEIIEYTITEVKYKKEQLNIVNKLIQQYFGNNIGAHAKGVEAHIKEMAVQETEDVLKNWFRDDWENKSEDVRKRYETETLNLYLRFLNGEQDKIEKASASLNKNPEIDYYKLPRLDEAIKQNLKKAFNISDKDLKKLYHPSDIEMYPVSKTEVKTRTAGAETVVKLLESPQPPSKGWKNPMAMRTLHELRHLLNYLLRIGKIDKDTKVIVEMARELNDANKRWAIQTHQRYREEENKEFAKAIVGVAKQKYPNIDENNIENINKVRLWWEQIENNEEVYKQIKALKEDIEKYRLWKEQECMCIYTGDMISLTDLFDGGQTNFEHTLPVSISFDNSLSNLTVCKAHYNMHIKKNQIPTQLENYSKDANGHSAILPRLKKWKDKVEHLKNLINENKIRTKKTQDPETKKGLIQKRHLLQFDYDYWKKKVETFTVKEVPSTWKNSQLVDTQIISKYARAYLKTVFEKVEVQKGTIVNDFKNIYQIKGNEKKDRSKHSHHAQDAATLTLIPGSARRNAILEEFYKAQENGRKYHTKPYENYESTHIFEIENNVIIYHITRNNALTETKKRLRKKGKLQYTKGDKEVIIQGNSIRGQLHEETFLGAIKVTERNEKGYPIKENGKFKLKQNKRGQDEIILVKRKSIADIKIGEVLDPLLKEYLQRQLDEGISQTELKDFAGNKIRHLRFEVFAPSYEKSLTVKKQTYLSDKEYKQSYRTNNAPGSNHVCLYYSGINKRQEPIFEYRFINLLEYSRIDGINFFKNEDYNTLIKVERKNEYKLSLRNIFYKGDRVVLYKKSVDEIDKNTSPKFHLFKVLKFNNSGSDYIFLQNHIEARPDRELGDGETEFIPEKYQPRLKLTADKFNFLVENKDFIIKPDGTIKWL